MVVRLRALAWIVPLFLAACTPHSPPPQVLGAVETPVEEATVATSAVISGWALDPSGVDRVEVRIDGANHAARYGITRHEIAQAHRDYPDSSRAGFEVHVEIDPLSSGRHEIAIVMVGRDGHETMLGRRTLIAEAAMKLWADRLAAAPGLADRRFFFLMAASAIPQGGAKDAERQYRPYYSATMRTGVTVPILYLRTTKGAAGDWVFDPGFEPIHRCKDRLVAEDSLNGVIAYAVEKKLPVQFSLNGGVWADSSCDTPEWDVNDHLEQDVANCQWTQDNVVYPDDYLKNLTGSIDSPELARVLTYNVYAAKVRHYKKRNLQAAARVIARFAREHPDLFVGVNLDADTYMNPFFEQKEWFDYNPGTIRQFRHWLRGTGPYAGKGEPGMPDLSTYRRKKPLALVEVNRIARKRWTLWNAVDPPRVFPGTPHDPLPPGRGPIWDDPWYQEWDVFRKHLVGLHYDELSQWVHEAGIATDRIYSAQGFVAPGPMLKPFAVRLDSHGQNYDSAGVSIEGAIPRAGHLGVILYGKSAQSLVPRFFQLRRQAGHCDGVERLRRSQRRSKRLPGLYRVAQHACGGGDEGLHGEPRQHPARREALDIRLAGVRGRRRVVRAGRPTDQRAGPCRSSRGRHRRDTSLSARPGDPRERSAFPHRRVHRCECRDLSACAGSKRRNRRMARDRAANSRRRSALGRRRRHGGAVMAGQLAFGERNGRTAEIGIGLRACREKRPPGADRGLSKRGYRRQNRDRRNR